jgi:hypothetical protein
MDGVSALIASLNASNWIAIVAVVIAAISASFTTANYLAGRRERRLRTYESRPEVKASINGMLYDGGWRSVQLHLIATDEDKNFKYNNWRIERAQLLRPWSAKLARAKDDDYASKIFYPETPVRSLEGKAEGKLQRFALEFFIKFDREEKGQQAKFKVRFSHVKQKWRGHTVRVWATLPKNSEYQG